MAAVIIPIVVLLVLLLAIFFCCLLFFVRKSRVHDDWSINFEELELQDLLGAGGYGEVPFLSSCAHLSRHKSSGHQRWWYYLS
jgi:hypothetical protein